MMDRNSGQKLTLKRLIRVNIARVVVAAIVVGLGAWAWWFVQPKGLPEGFAAGNGRIEAVEIDVAAKTAGRVKEILANEGDFVRAGQVLAKMDSVVLEAQLREAQAQLRRALIGIETAQSQVTQREAEKQAAEAFIAQRKAELDAAKKRLDRTEELALKGAAALSMRDDDRAAFQAAKAAVGAAEAQAAAAQAAIGRAKSDVIGAQASVDAARATIQRIQADLDDSVLKSPRDGRVQYRVAQPGEVFSPGGVVLNMVDLADVYMTFFLPTEQAGRVALGTEARLVLDAAPQYVIPAQISFVADVAQFTPKMVETEEERQKLMFRIKARIDPDLLRKHLHQVKTGLPGMVYVRLDPQASWPPELQLKLPQ
ncbi:HlyD family secretion protein [Alcanivorax sp. NBRC 101098]|uniref:HlyD family secretion protein n=1 Tax=unclassified Alcanivorax TaxID=2638842 RepID=UPI0004ABE7E8|nr:MULTISPECIES: HlyD family efflux transporter periplasmic adaptor subunit [unclassified Alcanivorax]BAP14758.1 HlyD family secretion protein [Alcanivorax sp. NBRC 101098]